MQYIFSPSYIFPIVFFFNIIPYLNLLSEDRNRLASQTILSF